MRNRKFSLLHGREYREVNRARLNRLQAISAQIPARKEARRVYCKNNKDKRRALTRAWIAANRDRYDACKAKHREKQNAKHRDRYHEWPEGNIELKELYTLARNVWLAANAFVGQRRRH